MYIVLILCIILIFIYHPYICTYYVFCIFSTHFGQSSSVSVSDVGNHPSSDDDDDVGARSWGRTGANCKLKLEKVHHIQFDGYVTLLIHTIQRTLLNSDRKRFHLMYICEPSSLANRYHVIRLVGIARSLHAQSTDYAICSA